MTAPHPTRMRLSRAKGFNLQEASGALNGLDAIARAEKAEAENKRLTKIMRAIFGETCAMLHGSAAERAVGVVYELSRAALEGSKT